MKFVQVRWAVGVGGWAVAVESGEVCSGSVDHCRQWVRVDGL